MNTTEISRKIELTDLEAKEIRKSILIYAGLLVKGLQRVPRELEGIYKKLGGTDFQAKENQLKRIPLIMEVLNKEGLERIEGSNI